MSDKCSIFSPRGPTVYYKKLQKPFSEDYPLQLICEEKLLIFGEDHRSAAFLSENVRKGIVNKKPFDQEKDYGIRFTIEYGDNVDKISLTAEVAPVESSRSEPDFENDVVIKISFARK
jgi:hypothetical protein